MIKKRAVALLLALAGLVGSVSPARAALAYSNGDVLLGFRASKGEGSSQSYLINLGNIGQFQPDAAPFELILGDIAADLVELFGEDWHDRDDLYWGIFGSTTGANPTLYASRERLVPTIQSDPWPTLANTGNPSSNIISVKNSFITLNPTGNTAVGGFQTNEGNTSSYNYQVTQPGTDFGSLSQWSSIEGDFSHGVEGTVLDLYRITTGGVTYRGNFTINEAGQIFFNSAPVPEPGTYLLILGAGAVFALRRRLKSNR